MGTSAGPNLAGIGRGGDSNLVLEMDAHDAKSYPGEPTTNLIAYPHYTGATLDTGQTGNNAGWGATWTYEISEIPGPNGTTVRAFSIELTAVVSPFTYSASGTPYNVTGINSQYAAMTSGTTYTASCWAKVEKVSGGSHTDENLLYFTGASSIGAPSMTVGPEWTHISSTVTPGATGNYRLYHYFYSVAIGDKIWFTMPQIEQKGYATPFVRSQLLDFSQQGYNVRPASVNLMIHGNVGTGQTFSDSSPSKHTITANGNTTHSAAQSKFGGGSIYFDGTGDYLRTAAADFLDGSWTVDCWFYYDGSFPGTVEGLIALDYDGTGGSSNNAMNLTVKSGAVALYVSSNVSSGWDIVNGTTGGSVSASAWNHGAVVFDGSTYKAYLNGSQVISVTSSTAVASQSSSQIIVGTTADGNSAQSWNGYIDEVRVTTGTALWTSNFTPPTRRNLSAPVVDRSGNDNGGNFNTKETTDVATYRDGEVIKPIASATWDFDGTDDKTSIKTDAFDLKCFTVAIKQGGVHAGPFPAVPGQVNVGMNIGTGGFNGIIMGSWTGTMDDETLSLWGYSSTNPSGSSATYIKDEIKVGWHIFTFNWNGSDYDIWVDGTKRITFARGGGSGHSGLLSGVTAFYPGWSSGWSTNYFEGNIAFFSAYDKSLSDQQIIENFHAKRNSLDIANWGNRDIVQNGLDVWLDAGVAASYPESGSTWYDLTANNYNGTIANATYDVYGDGSLSFDGSGDTVDVGPISTGGEHSNCTISIWMNKAAQVANYGNVYDCNYGATTYNKGPRMEVDIAGSVVRVYMGSDAGNYVSISFGSLSNDVWYNLVLTVTPNGSSQDLKTYTDGALVSSYTSSSAYVWDGDVADLYLGVGYTAGRHFTGKIAAFELYNRVLSASEIEQNFIVQKRRFDK